MDVVWFSAGVIYSSSTTFPSKDSQKGVTANTEILYVKDRKKSTNWDI